MTSREIYIRSRLKALGLVGLFFSIPAAAQITAFGVGGFPCDSRITVSGAGLTLTANGATTTDRFCEANVGKYSGTFYYTFTPGRTITLHSVGFSVGPTIAEPPNAPIKLVAGTYQYLGVGEESTTGYASNGVIWLNTFKIGSVAAMVPGKTGAIAVNLDTDPYQYWATDDITDLACNGSGGNGTTHPRWNASCANDPSLPGTGWPLSGSTGAQFFLSGYQIFPAVTLRQNDTTTLSFADNPTLDRLLPARYLPWNDNSGSTCSFPCPTDTITINVANAPGWQASHAYPVGSRVIAGPGWTPGSPGSFTNGQPLYLWALSGTSGTSGASQPAGFSSCASPAKTGGGFNGTPPAGWVDKTSVSDNGLTWVCLTPITYPNITDIGIDTPTNWSPSTGTCTARGAGCYWYHDLVLNNGSRVYSRTDVNTNDICTTAASGQGPTGTGSGITDGNCQWAYVGTLTYSPHTYPFPIMSFPDDTVQHYSMNLTWNVTIQLWDGGPAAATYQPGQNGENDPIVFGPHQGPVGETRFYCKHNYKLYNDNIGCMGYSLFQSEHLTAAPGDSFQDNMNPGSDPLRPDPTKGVMLYSNSPGPGGINAGDVFVDQDSYMIVDRLQFVSVNGTGFEGCCFGLFASAVLFYNNIFEGGGLTVLSTDAAQTIKNNVFIYSGRTAGANVIFQKYPSIISYNTIICNPGISNTFGIATAAPAAGPFMNGTPGHGVYPSPPIFGNAIFGCAVPWASQDALGFQTTTNNGHNATDLPSYYAPTTVDNAFNGASFSTAMIPGTPLTNLVATNEFVNPKIGPALDLRIKSIAADLYGAGATFFFGAGATLTWWGNVTPGNDIFNTPRTSRFDIGAAQFATSGPTASPSVGGVQSRPH